VTDDQNLGVGEREIDFKEKEMLKNFAVNDLLVENR